jgi:hypothetical protein
MRRRANEFRARLSAIEAAAPETRRQAERFILAHYRAHRELPRREKGAVTFIVPRRRLYHLIFRGELEHVLGLAPLLLRLAELRRRAVALRARLCR